MECINCGATINSQMAGQVVKCEYCGTTSAWIPTIRKIDTGRHDQTSELGKLLLVAQMDIDAKRYESATKTLNRAIEIDPTCWHVYANLAISTFWLGDADYSHLIEVIDFIKKAAELTDEVDVLSGVSRAISYNIAQLVNIKNPAGELLFRSVGALKTSKDLVPKFLERDEIIDKFVSRQSYLLSKRFMTQLCRDKKETDLPKSDLVLYGTLLELTSTPQIESQRDFIAFASFKLKRKQDIEIKKLLDIAIASYVKYSKSQTIPTVQFPFIGSPKIT